MFFTRAQAVRDTIFEIIEWSFRALGLLLLVLHTRSLLHGLFHPCKEKESSPQQMLGENPWTLLDKKMLANCWLLDGREFSQGFRETKTISTNCFDSSASC